MTESDCEIEYLDEDAEIVQQCVHPLTNNPIANTSNNARPRPRNIAAVSQERSLLVERELERKRKRKKDEDDSDYDPKEDLQELELDLELDMKKKKSFIPPARKPNRVRQVFPSNTLITSTGKKAIAIDDVRARKKLDIRIPDYDDPLCLPVRAIINTNSDLQRVRNWNNMCLEHFRNADSLLRPDKSKVKSSLRTVVLRNVIHKETGKQETAVWSKTCVEDTEGIKKSEIFQSILPKYREKKILKSYHIIKNATRFRTVNETLLTKEDHQDGNVLVVYKPREKISAVYKFVADPKKRLTQDEEPKKSLKEVVVCKVCAPCYQVSWRGTKKNGETPIKCAVCGRSSVSVYNLLTHLKVHSADDVRARSKALAASLAKVLDYHYKCRICQQQFLSIKSLRRHVSVHKGIETFKCEVGNHLAQ